LDEGILGEALRWKERCFFVAYLGGVGYKAHDLPVGSYEYGSATVYKRGNTSIRVILWGGTPSDVPVYNCWEGKTTWAGWKRFDGTAIA